MDRRTLQGFKTLEGLNKKTPVRGGIFLSFN